jgi:hypothetical protein
MNIYICIIYVYILICTYKYIYLEASARNIFNYAEQNEMKASMNMFRSKVLETLPNLLIFTCEAFPTFRYVLYMCIYIHIYIYIYIYMSMSMSISMYVCMFVYVW